MNNEVAAQLITTLFTKLLVVVMWITPIVLGIKTAKAKGYSPHWMWFGLHPAGGWIALIMLWHLDQRPQCPTCGQFVSSSYITCPFCKASLVRTIVERPTGA
jgi:hypothetical protein